MDRRQERNEAKSEKLISVYIFIKFDRMHHIDTSRMCFNRHEQRLEIEAGYEI